MANEVLTKAFLAGAAIAARRIVKGLSPLARGKRLELVIQLLGLGPIPAGAGETRRLGSTSLWLRAYPRWRGGNVTSTPKGKGNKGLSPLARGKHARDHRPPAHHGPIPAGAGETGTANCASPASRAYPRWRGGNFEPGYFYVDGKGLSPLARGKHVLYSMVMALSGPIPAGAGETSIARCRTSRGRAYPRWRGGNQPTCSAPCWVLGLSPLARGKRRSRCRGTSRAGPIPAGAGETRGRTSIRCDAGAYPRWRGGNDEPTRRYRQEPGLSPLARGKPPVVVAQVDSMGPIPAGAGETASCIAWRYRRRAYPRWRGGNVGCCTGVVGWRGPSPLARGKQARTIPRRVEPGPIPAGAGETTCRRSRYQNSGAHPRWRGGNRPWRRSGRGMPGPSPLARGKLTPPEPPTERPGPIPAGAGETRRPGRAASGSGAHPRWRGGNVLPAPAKRVCRGPSPLARGKLDGGEVLVRGGGPIPAGAGETRPPDWPVRCTGAHPRWRGGNESVPLLK